MSQAGMTLECQLFQDFVEEDTLQHQLRDFSERIGVSKVNSLTDISILETSIRDDLNKSAPRTMGVINPIKLIIENYQRDKIETLKAPIHPQNEEMGVREIFFSREIYIDERRLSKKSLQTININD